MSATYYSRSSPIAEEVQQQGTMFLHKMQGIVTVLGSDLKRDRSASKKCLSHDDSFSSSSEGEAADEERFQIWSTIQQDNNDKDQKHHENPPAKLATWSSILFDKAKEEENSNNSVTPYIHPLVKRSKSSLSKKSLEICTESLGSETGSDHVLSSDNSNYSSPSATEEEEQEQHEEHEEEELQVPKQNLHHHAVMMKKCMPRCFPPPLPSFHMRSHRDGNGRLFLEAVTVTSQNNNFCAQRQDGRLVLTFASDEEDQKDEVEEELEEEFEEEFMGVEEDDDVEEGKEYEEDENYDEGEAEAEEEEDEEEEEEDEVVEVEAVMEEEPLLSSGVITNNSVQRLAFMMNKPIGVLNRNTKNWSHKFNEVVNFEEQQQHGLVAQSVLPPRPRVVARLIPSAPVAAAAAASADSLNAYDCYWGTKHTSKVEHNKYSSVMMKNNDRGSKVIFYGDVSYWNSSDGDQQKLVVMRGKNGDYLVHKAKSCKDSRRSFLFWEPRCIAT